MTLLKVATFRVLSVESAQGQVLRADNSNPFVKQGHRHEFDYARRPGYIYVRSRAISSRTNDNFDQFPAEEIKVAYRTFVGKPVFVNHHNSDHRRARGFIIDAALHEDTNPDGSPDTWAEVLMEVDALRFPRLAEAVVKGDIARTSMGTDVQHSVCTACGNKAETPADYCFPPGELVTMADGSLRPIEAISEGDRVLTHDGVGAVTALMTRDYSGDLSVIHRIGYARPLRVTHGHEVLANLPGRRDEAKSGIARYASVHVQENWQWTQSEMIESGNWVQGAYPTQVEEFDLSLNSLAQDLVVRDGRTVLASPYRVGSQIGSFNYGKNSMPESVDSSSPALAFVLGLYAAEGSMESARTAENTPKCIQWSLGDHEGDIVHDLQLALDKLGAGQVKVYPRPGTHGISVRLSNAPLAALLEQWVGADCHTKHLVGEIMLAPTEFQREFLDAYHRGDGWDDPRGHVEVRTASDLLSRQLVMMGGRVDEAIPSWWENKKNPGGPSNRQKTSTIHHVSMGRHGAMVGRRHLQPGYFANRVVRTETEHYHGKVYNIEVAGQHSYVTEGVVVHNCQHIPAMKGMKYRKFNASLGRSEEILIAEVCFPPETPVLLGDGTDAPIQQISVGDVVVDHLGESRRVTGVTQSDWAGPLVTLIRKAYWKPLRMTPDHPVLILPRNRTANGVKATILNRLDKELVAPQFVAAREVQPGDYVAEVTPNLSRLIEKVIIREWQVPNPDHARTHPPEKTPDRYYVPSRAWGGRQHILRDCRSCGSEMDLYPSESGRLYCSSKCWGDGCARGNSGHAGSEAVPLIEDTITLNREFGRWCGWFLAEGSISWQVGRRNVRGVEFGLHKEEVDEAQEILDLGERLFGVIGSDVPSPKANSRTVSFSSAELAKFMRVMGDDCYTKALPDEWLDAPIEFIEGVVSAHSDGDGDHGGGRTGGRIDPDVQTHATSSPRLADQMYRMRLCLGHTPTLKTPAPVGSGKRTVPGHYVRSRLSGSSRDRVTWGPWSFTRVQKTEQQDYVGPVHNLSVEGTHTYVANGIAVHNCYGLGFFENSLLVEDPADPTAFVLGVDGDGVSKAATKVPTGRVASLTKTADEDQCPYCGGESLQINGTEFYCMDENRIWDVRSPEAKAYHGDGPERGVLHEGGLGLGDVLDFLRGGNDPRTECPDCGKSYRWSEQAHGFVCPAGHSTRPAYASKTAAMGDDLTQHKIKAKDIQEGDRLDRGGRTRVDFRHPRTDKVLVRTRTNGQRSPSIEAWDHEDDVTVYRKTKTSSLAVESAMCSECNPGSGLPVALCSPHAMLVKAEHHWGDLGPNSPYGASHFPPATAATRLRDAMAYGETKAPSQVDTLRADRCPVCFDDEAFNGDKCNICGHVQPPKNFGDPDLTKAKELDLRQDKVEAAPEADPAPAGPSGEPEEDPFAIPPEEPSLADPTDPTGGEAASDLQCTNCGEVFNAEGQPEASPSNDVTDEIPPTTPEDQQSDAPENPQSQTDDSDPADISDLADVSDEDLELGTEEDEVDPEASADAPVDEEPVDGSPAPVDDLAVDPAVDAIDEAADPADAEAGSLTDLDGDGDVDEQDAALSQMADDLDTLAPAGADQVEDPSVPEEKTTETTSVVPNQTCPVCGQGSLIPAEAAAPAGGDTEPVDQSQVVVGHTHSTLVSGQGVQKETSTDMNQPNPAQNYRSAIMRAVAEQQKVIKTQASKIDTLTDAVKSLVTAAGVERHPRFASLMAVAGDDVDTTTEQAKKPLATDDPESKGAAPGEANSGVTPAATTDLQNTNVAIPDSGTLENLQDVTKPTPGTDAVDPAAVFNGEVTVSKPTDEVFDKPSDSGWTGTPGSTNRTQSSRGSETERFTASLRLARLQQTAGLAPREAEDLSLAQGIFDGGQTLDQITTTASTLQQVAIQATANRPTDQHRNLVPQPIQAAAGVRRSPSFSSGAPTLAVTASSGDDEFMFGDEGYSA